MSTPTKTARESEGMTPQQTITLRNVSEDAPARAGLFRRVYEGTASPRQRIKAFCLECCGMDTYDRTQNKT